MVSRAIQICSYSKGLILYLKHRRKRESSAWRSTISTPRPITAPRALYPLISIIRLTAMMEWSRVHGSGGQFKPELASQCAVICTACSAPPPACSSSRLLTAAGGFRYQVSRDIEKLKPPAAVVPKRAAKVFAGLWFASLSLDLSTKGTATEGRSQSWNHQFPFCQKCILVFFRPLKREGDLKSRLWLLERRMEKMEKGLSSNRSDRIRFFFSLVHETTISRTSGIGSGGQDLIARMAWKMSRRTIGLLDMSGLPSWNRGAQARYALRPRISIR